MNFGAIGQLFKHFTHRRYKGEQSGIHIQDKSLGQMSAAFSNSNSSLYSLSPIKKLME